MPQIITSQQPQNKDSHGTKPVSYEDTIAKISYAISRIDASGEKLLQRIINEHSLKRFVIYRRNYLGTLLKVLQEDYPTVLAYIGFTNFRYLTKEFIANNKVKSANIFTVSKHFITHLHSSYTIHHSAELSGLASIDYLWSHPCHPVKFIKVSHGIISLYENIAFLNNNKPDNVSPDDLKNKGLRACMTSLESQIKKIDYSRFESIEVILEGENKYLRRC
ncbi:MAG: putative DNA-binding domain-containing protein [Proteobacteria bacterium]|nr:putative DNA-binding domain-containing protein [Pseudomonadota bacterium]